MNTQYYEKAVELGNMILASETSLRLADAKAVFEENEAAQAAYGEFSEFHKSMQIAQQSGFLTLEQYQEALGKLVEMEITAKQIPAVQEYLKAQEDYNNFVSSVLEMLKQTIGYVEPKSGGCGGGCGGHHHGKR